MNIDCINLTFINESKIFNLYVLDVILNNILIEDIIMSTNTPDNIIDIISIK